MGAGMRRKLLPAVAGALSMAASCAGPEVSNAPPEVLEDCRREVALLNDPEVSVTPDEPLPSPADETLPNPIEDARAAQEDAAQANLSEWSEEALLYRCFLSRGVELTDEQARTLAEWQGETDAE